MFSGVEIGQPIHTGPHLLTQTPANNPIRDAYIHWDAHFWRMWDPNYKEGSIHPHDSYDQTAVLYAVRGLKNYWQASPRGKNQVFQDASNEWKAEKDGGHRYLIQAMPPTELAKIIDSLMVQPPLKAK
jgi:hypothetical protein